MNTDLTVNFFDAGLIAALILLLESSKRMDNFFARVTARYQVKL